MTPPKTVPEGVSATAGTTSPAVSSCQNPTSLRILRKRSEFLSAARARKQGTGAFLLQGRDRRDDDAAIGIGFTCSKKVGNAVARNHAKRRLREIARIVLPELGRPGWDYVLVGKRDATAERDFTLLQKDLRYALRKVHGNDR